MSQASTVRVLPSAVPPESVRGALRLIWRDVADRGVSTKDLCRWRQLACPFPHLRILPEIAGLSAFVLDELDIDPSEAGVLCEPQIIWHLPDVADDDTVPWSHIDEEPAWAAGRRYLRIVGVALTDWRPDNGGLHVWDDTAQPRPVELKPGDAVVMSPDVPHTAGINRSGEVRIGVYYRWLEDQRPPGDGR